MYVYNNKGRYQTKSKTVGCRVGALSGLKKYLPGCHVPALATYKPNSAFPVSSFLTDFHSSTTKSYHQTTVLHQQNPAP